MSTERCKFESQASLAGSTCLLTINPDLPAPRVSHFDSFRPSISLPGLQEEKVRHKWLDGIYRQQPRLFGDSNPESAPARPAGLEK
jgi:hypothetical protein